MKIGLLGGTFDPIHAGHLYIARKAVAALSLDRVALMVAKVPPHKRGEPVTDAFHRFAMAALATSDDPRLFVSSWELHRPGPGYTIDTLRGLQRESPDDHFCFIAGGDSLAEIHLWKECGTLLREHCFLFVRRRGFGRDLAGLDIPGPLKKHIREICEKDKPSIQPGSSFFLPADPPPVSSTGIRETMASGGRLSPDAVPPEVLDHIRKYRLYEQNPRHPRQGL